MATKDLLLININAVDKVYQDLGKGISAIETPYLAALTAGFARKNGFEVEILDMIAQNMAVKEGAAEAVKKYPRLMHLVVHGPQPSASTQLMTHVGAFCREVKALDPSAKILLTGTHPSALPERTMKDEACDFVGQGEGFHTVLGLLQKKDFAEVPGLWHRNNDSIVPPKTPATDIKEADLPIILSDVAWDLLSMEKYRAHNWHSLDNIDKRQPYASIYTSFGCPYHCDFCCINAPFNKHTIRCFSSKWVGEQIQTLVDKYKVRHIKFIDEMFVLRPDHVNGVTSELINRGLGSKINIWAYTRVDTMAENYLPQLKKAGINWLVVGIESGSKHVRDGVEKGRFTDEDILKMVRKVQSYGINIMGNYIFGLPDDTFESMQDTLNMAMKANCEWANFYSAMAYPGSGIYTLAKQKGWALPDDAGGPGWIGYSQHAYDVLPLPTETLPAADVLRFRDWAHDQYFTNPAYLSMIEKKFGSAAVAHLTELLKHKLKRKILGT